jgi:protein tyrosine phosphatase (PTP) superfamily phosphohydrolase (DUF442 family)
MKVKELLSNFNLYGRSTWQIIIARLRSSQEIEDILNYRYISDRCATGGQPKPEEFALIKQRGYQTVINLAPPTAANALPNEREIVASLGMEYINIPVVWENPTLEDFTTFCEVMSARRDRSIFVHCAMNMRVSAFVYLYRCRILGVAESEALAIVTSVWQPNPTWQKFIHSVCSQPPIA